MPTSLAVTLSAQIALQRRLDVVAHDVANVDTPGFRAEVARFDSLAAQAGGERVAYAQAGAPYLSRRSGALSKTDGPLDVAVLGAGHLSIRTPRGIAYTRDGRLTMTATGALTTLDGDAVLDAGGAPLSLDPAGGPPTIARDGMVTQAGRQVGALGLFSIEPGARLARERGVAVVPDRPATPILDFTHDGFQQGAVEGSNVDAVAAVAELVTVQRGFEAVTAALDQTDTSLAEAIKALGAA